MSDIAIRVENLSKCYRIGLKEKMHDTFIGALTDFVRKPVENFRKLRRLARFDDEGEDIIWALKNVSFEVKRGEVVGIIGPNGAGKTTLLKLLSRITEPTSGRAVVNGRVGSLLEVGTGMHPELTGRENIYLSGTILGMTKAEIDRKFDEIVEFAELSKFIDTPVKRYSSGMKVRLGFAIAAHLEPEILLVDEVLAVGDASFQKKCLGKMGEVAGEGRTILFVSHHMESIQKLCEHCMYIEKGEINAYGKPYEVVQQYLLKNSTDTYGYKYLETLPRTGNLGERIKLISCTLFNSKHQKTNRVCFGEPIRICLEAKASHFLSNLSFFIGIDSLLGQRIVTINSEDSGRLYSASPDKILRVCVDIKKLIIKPGLYLITVGIRVGKYEKLDRLLHVMKLEIMNVSFGRKKLPTTPSGCIHTEENWSNE